MLDGGERAKGEGVPPRTEISLEKNLAHMPDKRELEEGRTQPNLAREIYFSSSLRFRMIGADGRRASQRRIIRRLHICEM